MIAFLPTSSASSPNICHLTPVHQLNSKSCSSTHKPGCFDFLLLLMLFLLLVMLYSNSSFCLPLPGELPFNSQLRCCFFLEDFPAPHTGFGLLPSCSHSTLYLFVTVFILVLLYLGFHVCVLNHMFLRIKSSKGMHRA